MLTDETIEQIHAMEAIAWRCIRTHDYFDLTTGIDSQFWTLVQNVMGENSCLLWGHIFGKRDDDLHYSQFFSRPDVTMSGPQFEVNAIKQRILARLDMDENTYREFHVKMMIIRDKYLAHRDLEPNSIIFPDVTKCRVMAEEVRSILSELVEIHSLDNPAHPELDLLSRYYEGHPNEALLNESRAEFQRGLKIAQLPPKTS